MKLTAPPEIVRASGCCAACDYRFTDELVARYPSGSAPGGYAYVELRHLDDSSSALRTASDPGPPPSQP